MVDLVNNATDFPLVNVQKDQHIVPIQHKGLAYAYTDRDIGRAMYVGENLPELLVRAAFRTAEETKERVFLNGDAGQGWDGMLNTTGVPREQSGGSWQTATDDTIFNEVNRLIGEAWTLSNASRICDTLLLPMESLYRTKPSDGERRQPLGAGISWQTNNPYTAVSGNQLMIRTLRQLDTAARPVRPTTRRAIAYPRDMDVLRFHVPQELQFIEPQRKAMSWVYYGSMALAGLEIMEPNALRYLARGRYLSASAQWPHGRTLRSGEEWAVASRKAKRGNLWHKLEITLSFAVAS